MYIIDNHLFVDILNCKGSKEFVVIVKDLNFKQI